MVLLNHSYFIYFSVNIGPKFSVISFGNKKVNQTLNLTVLPLPVTHIIL